MKKFLGLVYVCAVALILGLSQSLALAGEPLIPIERGSDGSVRLAPDVEYVPSGLQATAEASRYPHAIQQVVTEGKTSVPVAIEVTGSRMIGLLTWRETIATTLWLVREGEVIKVRPPASEAEKQEETREQTNPFGLLASLSLLSLVIGNMVAKKNIFVAAAFALAALAFAALAFAAYLAVVAAYLAVVAVLAFAFALAAIDTKAYRWFSGLSATCMLVAVGLAVWG